MERIIDCTKMLTLEMQKGFEWIRKLEKEKQNKPKANGMEIVEIIAEINEIENW